MTVSQVVHGSFSTQLPDPGHFWLRFAPRQWRGPERAWTNLAAGGLRSSGGRRHSISTLPGLPARALDDVVYLPPVERAARGARDALARDMARQGSPVLVQVMPGEAPPGLPVLAIYDLLQPLLTGNLALLAELPRGSQTVWPLIAGVTDDPALVRSGLEILVAAGVAQVQGLTLDLAPADRRWLAGDGDEQRFAKLFHAPPPSERDFAVRAEAFGYAPFMARPALSSAASSPTLRTNRRLGEALALSAELWLRLGKPVSRGQAFYRAMRYIDRCRHDLGVLFREGNLGVLEWLDPDSRAVVEETLQSGESRLLAQLLAAYLGKGGGGK